MGFIFLLCCHGRWLNTDEVKCIGIEPSRRRDCDELSLIRPSLYTKTKENASSETNSDITYTPSG